MPGSQRAASVIVGGARTPIGRLLGALGSVSAVELGAHAVRAALARSGVTAGAVERVILGNVLQAGLGQNPARQAAVAAGIPMGVPAVTVNKVCLSSLEAIVLADLMIRAGEAEVIVAGGMESMTQAPHVLPALRAGVRYGDARLVDTTAHDALTCAFDGISMGEATERYTAAAGIDRAAQDAVAVASHVRAAAAQAAGRFDDELVPVVVPQRRGDDVAVDRDEGVRPDTTEAGLARLRPAFADEGTLTAGNSSQISDGAAAVVVMSRERAERDGLPWLAEIVATGSVAGPDTSLLFQPANAIEQALARAGLRTADVDLAEINEAFAAVAVASQRRLGWSDAMVNVDGGAIALGHPVGASGARIALHLAHALRARGGGLGAAALCGGGGQGAAVLLRV